MDLDMETHVRVVIIMDSWQWVLLILLVGYAVFLSYWLTSTARRLDRLHKRVDNMLMALDGALQRRAAVACIFYPQARSSAHHAAHYDLDNSVAGSMQRRADAEAEMVTLVPQDVWDNRDMVEAQIRLDLAVRFYNEAVQAACLVRQRFWVRTFRLGGYAPLPQVYPTGEPEGAHSSDAGHLGKAVDTAHAGEGGVVSDVRDASQAESTRKSSLDEPGTNVR